MGGQPDPNFAIDSNPRGTGVEVVGTGFGLNLGGLDAQGRPLALAPNGALVLEPGSGLRSSGRGFLPNSEVSIYLVDGTPPAARTWFLRTVITTAQAVPVGQFTTDAEGAYSGTADIPRTVKTGPKVLQTLGWSPTNEVRVLNLGVRIDPSIVLNKGARVSVGKSDRVRATGEVIGLAPGTKLTPYFRYTNQREFRSGGASIVVKADGSFTWSRLVRRGSGVIAYVAYKDDASNRVTWARLR